jgi:hypothetical protein
MAQDKWHFKLMGADEDSASERPDISELELLSNYEYYDVHAYGLYPTPTAEGEITESLDKFTYGKTDFRFKFQLKIRIKDFPTTKVDLFELFPELSPFAFPYTWIYSSDYTIGFKTENQALAVALTEVGLDLIKDKKMLILSLQTRDVNNGI